MEVFEQKAHHEFELDRTKSKNNIADNSVALGHDTHNNYNKRCHVNVMTNNYSKEASRAYCLAVIDQKPFDLATDQQTN